MNRLSKITGFKQLRAFFSQVTRTTPSAPIRREHLQFSKHRLVDFGELPLGEVPDALKFTRPSNLETLPNGVRIATEQWAGDQAAY